MRLSLSVLLLLCVLLPAAATEIANGQTAMISLAADDDARLFYRGKEIPLLQHPADPDQRIALIPVGYRTAPGEKQLHRLSPQGDELIPFRIIDGGYPSETLHVQPSKVKPNPEQQKRVSREYREAMAIYGRFTPQRYWSTPFALPMESNVTSIFGTARLFNGSLRSFHSGTDFRAKPGTPVYAVNDGVVVLAKERYYAGNSVLVDHGEGLYSCYYHLSRIDVKVGDKVAKGAPIGLSGNTGRVTGPHLHFAVMLQGVQVDPMQLLPTLNGLFQETKTARLDTSRAADAE
ncbi:M23 family metallopeptidase [Sulfurimonas sp. HSL1-6]|uniref:M23 family metallopeptidase n=1 Tax=Thiomicrolovo immobilis TaxID=3131935 RepID=UPI0031FA44DF